MFFHCTGTTKATATTTAIKRTTTTAAFWLFTLTFISLQCHRLTSDCCYGAALLMQHETEEQQQHQQQQQKSTGIDNQPAPPSLKETLPPTAAPVAMINNSKKSKRTINDNENHIVDSVNMSIINEISKQTTNIAEDPANVSVESIPPPLSADANLDSLQLERRHVVTEKLQYTSEICIKQGRLVGIIRHMHPLTGLQDVNQYLGLPYAEAPVGSRRFMPPGAALPWQGLKMARHLPAVCPQKLPDISSKGNANLSIGRLKQLTRLLPYLKVESEDCLYLNVYVPRGDGFEQRNHLYPVLVYIHGESFEWNSGNPYDGSVLASYGQVIVVTVNYRLGALGFMKPGIQENAVANFGLLDQIAALHWIKENIGFFGGDHDSVTLMGHSTGAACVNYLMVSPVTSGLFHRAILMSGSAMSDWAASNHSLQLTLQIANSLDCPLNDEHEEMLDCLRSKSYQDILKISTTFPQFLTLLGPIVDGHVIPNQPYKVMGQNAELFGRYDLLFGITESEAYHALGALALQEGLSENERDNLLRFYMQSRFDVRPDLALAATLKKYNDMYNNPIKATNMEHRDVVLDILSDARIVGPLMQTGLFHAEVNPHNYMYVFGHNSAMGPHASLPHSIGGEELAFVFGAPLAPSGPFHTSYSKQEKLLSEAVMAYWTNFAKTGNPKAPWKGTFLNLHALEWDRYDLDWPEFNKRTQAYINIGIPPSIGYKYRQIYMNFWNKELPDELNQIADIQQQPFLKVNNIQYNGGGSTRIGGHEVIAGQMSKYGSRSKDAEDPLRTLRLLLQESHGVAQSANAETAENMYNAPPTFGVAKQSEDDINYGTTHTVPTNAVWGVLSNWATTTTSSNTSPSEGTNTGNGRASNEAVAGVEDEKEIVAKSETTLHLLIGLIVVFILLNVIIYSTFLFQKKRKKSTQLTRKLGAGAGGILSYDGNTDDELKRSKHATTLDGDDSYILDVVRKSNTYEAVRTDRSPINGYKITRQLSSSTVDTHTKVCEWMAGRGGGTGGVGGIKLGAPLAPSECLSLKTSKQSSSPTFSTLRGSNNGGGSFHKHSRKINVAVDATPQTRGESILCQEPIEFTKMKADGGRQIIICQEVEVTDQELLTPQETLDATYGSYNMLIRQHSAATEACDYELPPQQDFVEESSLKCVHQHSRSDPVDLLRPPYAGAEYEKVTSFMQPMTYGGGVGQDINVTSRDDDVFDGNTNCIPLTAAEQLSVIKRRNYPKVLPTNLNNSARSTDSPPMTADLSSLLHYKRNSLPPNSQILLGLRIPPPMPPPRTVSTLGRKPSLGRRSSGDITTSPVQLAHDIDEDGEAEAQEITQNTLIVGPLIPKCDYLTLRRQKSLTDREACKLDLRQQQNSFEFSYNEAKKPSAALHSFDSQRPQIEAANVTKGSHHTEAIYAIQPTANLLATSATSLPNMTPITPTTPLSSANFSTAPNTPTKTESATAAPGAFSINGAIYAQPTKSAIKGNLTGGGKSNIPRMLQVQHDVAATTTATTTTTTKPVITTATTTIAPATTATSNTSLNSNTNMTSNQLIAATGAIGAASRIPQLNRNLNTFQQLQQQQQQQQLQQQQSNKASSAVDVVDKITTIGKTPSATATTLVPANRTITSTPEIIHHQQKPSTASTANCVSFSATTTTATATTTPPTKSLSTESSASSSSSSSSSATSSLSRDSSILRDSYSSGSTTASSASSSSTGTVRTELKQKHKK